MNNPIDLLNEANAFLSMLTGNLSDNGTSLDDSQTRLGFSLTLIEAMNRIRDAASMLEARDIPEPATVV